MGYGAIYELTRILDAFRTELPEPNLTFNVGMVQGGTIVHVDEAGNNGTVTGKDNVIAPAAYASGDIRTISNRADHPHGKEDEGDRRKASAQNRGPRSASAKAIQLCRRRRKPSAACKLNRANASLGFTAMPELDPMKRGAGDIAFVADIVPGLAGVGATGEGAHAPGETIDLSAQPINTKRDALLMYRLTQIDQKADLTTVTRQ